MQKIEILQLGAYAEYEEGLLNETFTMHRYFEMDDPEGFLKNHGENIKAIATRGDLGASGDLIRQLPNLEMIAVYGVGYDAVDLDAAREKGVYVTNTPDVLTEDVADFAVAMILVQARGMIDAEHWVQDNSWQTKGNYPLVNRVHGKKLGILGLGRIGHAIAKRMAAFNMDIAYSATAPKPDTEDWKFIKDPVELAKHSDFFVVALAASAATKHIVNKHVIEAVGNQGMIVNISRASNIDEEALLDALEKGTLGAAALDVFEGEPKINPRFFALKNVLLQPHHGSATFETRKAMGQLVFDNLKSHFENNKRLTPVN